MKIEYEYEYRQGLSTSTNSAGCWFSSRPRTGERSYMSHPRTGERSYSGIAVTIENECKCDYRR